MENYRIKKAGIGAKLAPDELTGRVFEHHVLGMSLICEIAYYAKNNILGYPAMVMTNTYGTLRNHLVFVPENEETWKCEIADCNGRVVDTWDLPCFTLIK